MEPSRFLASAATLWARRYLTAGHVNRIRAEATNNRCLAAGGNWTEAVERQQTLVNELLLSSSISSSELLVDQVIVFAHLLGGYWIERAYPYVSRVLEITTVKLGPDHPSVLECQDLFVRILIAQKDYSKAINVALGVIFSGYRVFGESHPFTAMAIGKLGIAQLHLGDIESAVASLETATEKLIARFSNEHEYATAFMGSLADAYRQLGKDKDAERITKLLNVPLISRIFNQ